MPHLKIDENLIGDFNLTIKKLSLRDPRRDSKREEAKIWKRIWEKLKTNLYANIYSTKQHDSGVFM